MRIQVALVPILVATAFVATALVGGSAAAAGPAYTDAQLAPMVLTKSELGDAARGLDVKLGSGLENNTAAAEDTLDPKDTAGQLTRGGRISGYSVEYDELAFKRLVRGKGVLAVGSSVDLFKSAAAADAYNAKQLRDGKRYDGKYVDAGFRLTGWRTAPVRGLGKGAVLVRETLRLGNKGFYGTLVAFRSGPLIGSVAITRADAKSDTRLVVALARQLAKRMKRAGRGSLGFQPLFMPQTARKGQRPAGGPDLSSMAFAPADLPAGGRLVSDGYVANRTALGKYAREVDFTGAAFGGAGLFSVETEVNLLRTNAEASGVMVRLTALYNSDDVGRAFTDGFKVKGVKIEQRGALAAGDAAAAVVLRFTVNGRTVHIAQISLRVGRVVGLLNVGVVGPGFQTSALVPLAGRLAARIQHGL